MTKVLKFEYTKRAREKNPGECAYAQKVIRRALPYAVEHFDIPWSKLKLRIDSLPKEKGNRQTVGYAKVHPDGTYYIVINCAVTRFEEDYVNTFGHELTHCEQYYRRRLTYTPFKDKVIWEGKLMTISDSREDTDFADYYNTPWEVEAREKADTFYQFFKKERKKKSWWNRLWMKLRLHTM